MLSHALHNFCLLLARRELLAGTGGTHDSSPQPPPDPSLLSSHAPSPPKTTAASLQRPVPRSFAGSPYPLRTVATQQEHHRPDPPLHRGNDTWCQKVTGTFWCRKAVLSWRPGIGQRAVPGEKRPPHGAQALGSQGLCSPQGLGGRHTLSYVQREAPWLSESQAARPQLPARGVDSLLPAQSLQDLSTTLPLKPPLGVGKGLRGEVSLRC